MQIAAGPGQKCLLARFAVWWERKRGREKEPDPGGSGFQLRVFSGWQTRRGWLAVAHSKFGSSAGAPHGNETFAAHRKLPLAGKKANVFDRLLISARAVPSLSLHRSLRALPRQGFHRFFFPPFHVENLARIRIYIYHYHHHLAAAISRAIIGFRGERNLARSERERERDLFTPIFCQRFPPSDHGYVRVTYIRRQKSICANESSRNDVEKRWNVFLEK